MPTAHLGGSVSNNFRTSAKARSASATRISARPDPGSIFSFSPTIAAGSTTAAAQSIEITSSGEPLVNGIYHHHHSTTSNSSSSSIYIHSSGPFHIHQQQYDICIFPKVYGDKFRWCIGLVPCTAVQHDGNNDDDDQEQHTADVHQPVLLGTDRRAINQIEHLAHDLAQ